MCLPSCALAVLSGLLSYGKEPMPPVEMEMFIIMSLMSAEMDCIPTATAFHSLLCCAQALYLTKHFC